MPWWLDAYNLGRGDGQGARMAQLKLWKNLHQYNKMLGNFGDPKEQISR